MTPKIVAADADISHFYNQIGLNLHAHNADTIIPPLFAAPLVPVDIKIGQAARIACDTQNPALKQFACDYFSTNWPLAQSADAVFNAAARMLFHAVNDPTNQLQQAAVPAARATLSPSYRQEN